MDRVLRGLQAALLCVVAACTPTWQRAAVTTEILALGSLACDGGTTEQFLNARARYENNPILGPTPSAPRLWGYLGTIGLGLAVANRKLSPRWAIAANLLVLGLETSSIAHNMSIGSSACGVGDGGPWR